MIFRVGTNGKFVMEPLPANDLHVSRLAMRDGGGGIALMRKRWR
jgi:hypothetical protein